MIAETFVKDRAFSPVLTSKNQCEFEPLKGMSRLDAISDWENRARMAGYHARVLAEQVGVCERQLRRHFARQFQFPAQHWMERLRLGDAWPLLLAGEPVKSVAFRLGFKQPSHFSAAFKRAYGISPSACRSAIGNQECPPEIRNVRRR